MGDKRPFADFSRFAFVDDDQGVESILSKEPDQKRVKAITPTVASHPPSNAPLVTNKLNINLKTNPCGLAELYKSSNSTEKALKLLVVGHNPSDQSWTKGHYYANPSNRMWFLLGKAGIVPTNFKADCDQRCPNEFGVGFTDIMSGVPDTQSCNISDATLKSYKNDLYKRLHAHILRASAESGIPVADAYPRVIAFAGVRQWKALFRNGFFDDAPARREKAVPKSQPLLTNMFFGRSLPQEATSAESKDVSLTVTDKAATVDDSTCSNSTAAATSSSSGSKAPCRQSTIPYGVQTQRPDDWPAVLQRSVVFLLPSSSGAAAMSNADREGPYLELGRLLQQEEYQWEADKGLCQVQNGVPAKKDLIDEGSGADTAPPADVDENAKLQECIDLSASPESAAAVAETVHVQLPGECIDTRNLQHEVIDLS